MPEYGFSLHFKRCKQYKIYISETKNTGLAVLASPVAYFGRYSSRTWYRLTPKLLPRWMIGQVE